MILNDASIFAQCQRRDRQDLIFPFDVNALLGGSYHIHAEKAFLPESGREAILGNGNPLFWTIKPGQALVLKTVEHVNVPNNLMGMYTQLNRLAERGLSLMNSSLVEPQYCGPLSCQLVNFSRHDITLKPGDIISKITFHQLTDGTATDRIQIIGDYQYDTSLCESASVHPSSFLDIAKLESRVREDPAQDT